MLLGGLFHARRWYKGLDEGAELYVYMCEHARRLCMCVIMQMYVTCIYDSMYACVTCVYSSLCVYVIFLVSMRCVYM